MDMNPKQLAKRLRLRISRKHDGTFQLMRGNGALAPPGTMASIEAQLDWWRRAHNEGMTVTSACGKPMYSTEPARRKV
jgi:hypothetical protein